MTEMFLQDEVETSIPEQIKCPTPIDSTQKCKKKAVPTTKPDNTQGISSVKADTSTSSHNLVGSTNQTEEKRSTVGSIPSLDTTDKLSPLPDCHPQAELGKPAVEVKKDDECEDLKDSNSAVNTTLQVPCDGGIKSTSNVSTTSDSASTSLKRSGKETSSKSSKSKDKTPRE